MYWGEYPLSFAACLGQEECYRLMLSRGADPDAQDTNGNTVLHLLVIYQKIVLNIFQFLTYSTNVFVFYRKLSIWHMKLVLV